MIASTMDFLMILLSLTIVSALAGYVFFRAVERLARHLKD